MSLADFYAARGKQLVLIAANTKAFKGTSHRPAAGAFPLHPDSPSLSCCGKRFTMAITHNDATQLRLDECEKCSSAPEETIDIIGPMP